MSNLTLALSALIGGGAGALDAIDGDSLSDGDAAVVVLSTGVYHYHLNASSGATENSPYVIAPDFNPGTKRWVLVTPAGAFSHVTATETTGQNIPNATQTTIIYNTEIDNTLGEYNASTGIFTAVGDKRILISASCFYSAAWGAAPKIADIYLIHNTTKIRANRQTTWAAITADANPMLSIGVSLLSGETLKIETYQNQGGAVALAGGADFNYLTIDQIA